MGSVYEMQMQGEWETKQSKAEQSKASKQATGNGFFLLLVI